MLVCSNGFCMSASRSDPFGLCRAENLLEFSSPRSPTVVRWSVPAFLPRKASVGPPLLRRFMLKPLPHPTPLVDSDEPNLGNQTRTQKHTGTLAGGWA